MDSQGLAEVKAVVLYYRNSVAMVETLTLPQVPHGAVCCESSRHSVREKERESYLGRRPGGLWRTFVTLMILFSVVLPWYLLAANIIPNKDLALCRVLFFSRFFHVYLINSITHKNLSQRHRIFHLKVSVLEGSFETVKDLEGRKHPTSVSQLCHQQSRGLVSSVPLQLPASQAERPAFEELLFLNYFFCVSLRPF